MKVVLWNKISAKNKTFFVIFGLCAKTCQIFGEKNSGELSKLHSTCADERCEELFSGKKIKNFMVLTL